MRTSEPNKSEKQESITADTSGYRNVGSGTMAVEGSIGYYWSASPSSATYGWYRYFDSGRVAPQGDGNRGFGFPLRCIQGFILHGANRCSRQNGGTEG